VDNRQEKSRSRVLSVVDTYLSLSASGIVQNGVSDLCSEYTRDECLVQSMGREIYKGIQRRNTYSEEKMFILFFLIFSLGAFSLAA
jgi:hypothetical protein